MEKISSFCNTFYILRSYLVLTKSIYDKHRAVYLIFYKYKFYVLIHYTILSGTFLDFKEIYEHLKG